MDASERLEMKRVARRELTGAERDRLAHWLRQRFMHPFAIEFSYHDTIPRGPGGKYLDFDSDPQQPS